MKPVKLIVFIILLLAMPVVFYMALAWVPPEKHIGEPSRLLYFHVPVAWTSVLAFIASGYYSIRYLKSSDYRHELYAYNAAYAGLVYSILTVITGSIWAHLSWNSYWNDDPRERSALILLLIYIAYFSLYISLKGKPNRGRISAVYLIIAAVIMPFFVFIVPRVYMSLHPDMVFSAQKSFDLESSMRITLFISAGAFTLFYFYIMNLMNRTSVLAKKIMEKINDD